MSEKDVKPEHVEQDTAAVEDHQNNPSSDLATRLTEAEAKASENWDLALRTKAEMENMRRRTERDLENAHKFALEKFALELLPVKDSLELGLDAASQDNAGIDKLVEGTSLTLKMLENALEKFGVKVVDPTDQAFNPEFHQAVSMLDIPGKAANTVVNVMQKGYTLNERLIRPAMVVVAKGDAPKTGGNIDEKA